MSAVRARFRRPERVFRVTLTVHTLDSIPPLHRLLYLHWRCRRATPPDGRTPSKPVESGNHITWNYDIVFTIPIPSDPSDPTILQPTPLTLHLRSERRGRWVGMSYKHEGIVELDVSEIAAVGFLSKNHLVQHSMLNTTLKLSVRVAHLSGDKIFRTRTLPPLPNPSTPSTPPPPHDSPLSTHIDHPDADDVAPAPSLSANSNSSSAVVQQQPPSLPPPPTTVSELFSSIPDPHVVQKKIYEALFEARMRDSCPPHVLSSRYPADECVDAVFAEICLADGIGVPPEKQQIQPNLTTSTRVGVQGAPVTQMLLTRKPTIQRSTSLSELSVS